MILFAIIFFCIQACLAIYQLVIVLRFCALFHRDFSVRLEDHQFPKAAILLPLRGADPQLYRTLESLISQDFPDYELHIIVDRPDDPSNQVIDNVLSEHDVTNVFVHTIENRRATCSPQSTALYQAASNLDDSFEVVCTVDGDCVAHRTWLKELTAPLVQDESIGVVHGNRWYMPPDSRPGSIVRYLWNAAAVVPMFLLGIPWAGSFAIRRSVLIESGLLDEWPKTIVPDAPTKRLVTSLGKKIHFAPSLMMVNRESCDLSFSLDFLKRQMMWTRLYHPHWWIVLTHAIASTLTVLGLLGLTATNAVIGNWVAFSWLMAGLILYATSLLLTLSLEEYSVRKSIRRRGSSVSWLTPAKMLMIPLCLPLTQVIHMLAVLLAHFKNKVTWRGITYQVSGPQNVQVLDDSPFDQKLNVRQNQSL